MVINYGSYTEPMAEKDGIDYIKDCQTDLISSFNCKIKYQEVWRNSQTTSL